MSVVIGYTFADEGLLEEALESAGSGVRVVGETKRVCEAGNRELAVVGEGVMELVLRDQCYLFRIPEGEFFFFLFLFVSFCLFRLVMFDWELMIGLTS